MLPVLLTLGSFQVSSFGLFLALAFLTGVFVCWRVARTYDINEEKVVDLIILSFFGGILGSRLYFVVTHLNNFTSFDKILMINRYPGLSFWGGILGGTLAFWFFTKRTRFNFWQIADFAAVGLIIGVVIGNIGCFLGGCSYGIVSELPIATHVVGLIGKRLPIAVIESILLLIIFSSLWKQVIRFHFAGKIVSLAFIWLGVVKLVTEFYRGDSVKLPIGNVLSYGHLFSTILLVSGIVIYYQRSKRNFVRDLVGIKELFTSKKERKIVLFKVKKSWYNYKVGFKIKTGEILAMLKSSPKKLKRRFNVKSTPKVIR